MKIAVFYFYMYIYGVIYTGNIYCVNYAQNDIYQMKKNPGLLIVSSLILANPYLYERT